jgi:hypothetical protein
VNRADVSIFLAATWACVEVLAHPSFLVGGQLAVDIGDEKDRHVPPK